MTLDDLGNIGEFVAAIGVIISLLYVAVQIRQNNHHLAESNRSLRLAEMNATAQGFSNFRSLLIPHPEVGDLFERGMTETASLSPGESRRFSLLVQELFFAGQNLYMRTREGVMPEVSWEGTRALLIGMLKAPGIAAWWARDRGVFDPAFVAQLDAAHGPSA